MKSQKLPLLEKLRAKLPLSSVPNFFLQLGFLGIQNIANPDILLLEFPVDLNNGKLIEDKTSFFRQPQSPPANVWHPLHLPLRAQGGYLSVPQSGR